MPCMDVSFSTSTARIMKHMMKHTSQNDFLDGHIPSKLTLSVYLIWSMKCRYDPKYAPQYKSKHTKHVKLSKKVLKPLDTQK